MVFLLEKLRVKNPCILAPQIRATAKPQRRSQKLLKQTSHSSCGLPRSADVQLHLSGALSYNVGHAFTQSQRHRSDLASALKHESSFNQDIQFQQLLKKLIK